MLEQAFAVADRHRRPFLAFMAANIRGQFTWGIGAPDEAQWHFERPLALPYTGDAAYRRQITDGIGRCHATRGELEAARRHLPTATPTWITHSLQPVLDLWDGDLDAVDALARRTLETSRRTGNRWDEWAAQQLAARVRRLRDEPGPAVEMLEAALAIVVDGGAPYFELWVRPDLARRSPPSDAWTRRGEQLDRCRAITEAGEDWRGRAGTVAFAEAVTLAHADRADDAERAFAEARAVLAAHKLQARRPSSCTSGAACSRHPAGSTRPPSSSAATARGASGSTAWPRTAGGSAEPAGRAHRARRPRLAPVRPGKALALRDDPRPQAVDRRRDERRPGHSARSTADARRASTKTITRSPARSTSEPCGNITAPSRMTAPISEPVAGSSLNGLPASADSGRTVRSRTSKRSPSSIAIWRMRGSCAKRTISSAVSWRGLIATSTPPRS